jgi:hypothetical protein
MLEFEVRHWMTNNEAAASVGNLFYGSKGYLVVNGDAYKTYLDRNQTPGPAGSGGGNHFKNFTDAVRSRNRESLNAEIEIGAASTVLVHLANISYRVGRTVNFDPKTMTITGDPEAAKLMTRAYRAPFVVPEKV